MEKIIAAYKLSATLSGAWLAFLVAIVVFARIRLGYFPVGYNSEHDPSSIGLDIFLLFPLMFLLNLCAVISWVVLLVYLVVTDKKSLRVAWFHGVVALFGIVSTSFVLYAATHNGNFISGFFDWLAD